MAASWQAFECAPLPLWLASAGYSARQQPFRKKTDELELERLSEKETPVAHVDAKWASDKRLLSRVYGAVFLLRAARACGRNLRSPRITYSTYAVSPSRR
jgi:hypothetical protein